VAMVLSQDRTPRAVLDDIAKTRATVFPGMPVFYQAFCEMEKVASLPKLRVCISAGAPLPIATAKKFREKFRLPIHSFYGASECGGICYDRDGMRFEDGFVGPPMKNVDVKLVEPESASSQICVRSAAVGEGYLPEADENKLSNGIFVPDDLLVRTDSGFKIVGRISDVINVAGKKVNPAEVETQLLKFPGVRQAVVFGRQSPLRNEEVAACVVADVDPANGRKATLRESDLLEFCRATLSGWQTPKRVFIVEEIPTSERGKISRRELARRFAA
jgi:long-chain acyl-CoA synthetase